MTRCPSDLELERRLRDPAGLDAHVFRCPRCAARVAELRRIGEEFLREVFPATVDAVVARSAVSPRPARPLLWAASALAAAAAAALVLSVRAHLATDDDDAPLDGPGLTLVAFAEGATGAAALQDGQAVPASAGLRLQVSPGRSCNLFVASTDAVGRVSRIFPSDGREGLSVKAGGTVTVPAPAALDGRPGPQRFFAVCGCGDEPVTWAVVVRAAEAVGTGEARVRAAQVLSGLPRDALQTTLLVEKRR